MKTMLKAVSLFLFTTGTVAALHAQTKTIVYGRTTISNSSLLQYIASFSVTVTDLEGNPLQNTGITLPIKEGVIDLKTGAAEVIHSGGYQLRGNGNTVRLQDFTLDTAVPDKPRITGLFILNDKLLGRVALFDVKVPATVTLPLHPQQGVEQVKGLSLTLSQSGAIALNNALIISEPVLQPATAAGTADFYSVLSPDGSDD